MPDERLERIDVVDNAALVERLLQIHLEDDELDLPALPDVAVRIIRNGTANSANAQLLAEIIHEDRELNAHVLGIAASAAKRPVTPIVSLQHAVAWLGFDEVANIAFTAALQGRMLDVDGQKEKARRLWRHALASALWSRHLAQLLHAQIGLCYLSGLVHGIGKVVTLGAVNDLSRRALMPLAPAEFDRLIEAFHRPVGVRVVRAWQLPAPVLEVTLHWETCLELTHARFEATIVNVAHRLADYLLFEPTPRAREALVSDPAYQDLGLSVTDGNTLFDAAGDINAELDRHLAR
jgi:HD-like signal output (HDOD) protein